MLWPSIISFKIFLLPVWRDKPMWQKRGGDVFFDFCKCLLILCTQRLQLECCYHTMGKVIQRSVSTEVKSSLSQCPDKQLQSKFIFLRWKSNLWLRTFPRVTGVQIISSETLHLSVVLTLFSVSHFQRITDFILLMPIWSLEKVELWISIWPRLYSVAIVIITLYLCNNITSCVSDVSFIQKCITKQVFCSTGASH